ncbi:MAG: hypothetical protein EBX57_11135, partial [Betaproteobacteria bacterium]|nr:hypothetical protein [Betaproteobacteria bacterium]
RVEFTWLHGCQGKLAHPSRVTLVFGDEEGGDPYWQVVLHELPDRLPVSRRQWSVVRNLVS